MPEALLLAAAVLLLASAARRFRDARRLRESKARLLEAALRRTEESLAREEACDAARILLEARAPLTVMGACVDLASAERLSAAAAADMERMRRAALLCERLLVRGLEAARRPPARVEAADAAEVLESAAHLRETEARLRGVEIVRRYAPGAQPVLIDVGAMERVFLNLVSNGLDSSPSGSALRLSTELARAPDGTPLSVRVIVEDSGPGIPPDPPGLRESRRTVLLCGGSLWAEGGPEGGARFVVEIPQGRPLPSAARTACPSRPSSHLSR